MSPLMIAQLIIAIGPAAFELIPKLASAWSKPSLSETEVRGMLEPAKKSYDDYIAAARAQLAVINPGT